MRSAPSTQSLDLLIDLIHRMDDLLWLLTQADATQDSRRRVPRKNRMNDQLRRVVRSTRSPRSVQAILLELHRIQGDLERLLEELDNARHDEQSDKK